jgi:hypothetical protein
MSEVRAGSVCGAVIDSAGRDAPRVAPARTQDDELLRRLLDCGAKGSAVDATGPAVVAYWLWLRDAALPARTALVERLRDAIEHGQSGVRAWVPVILGDDDFELVRAAAAAYVGARPVSIERLERAVLDAIDWIRRGLTLNRAAVFVALLDHADDAAFSRLANLRGRLTPEEARTVWAACDATRHEAVRNFVNEWRATFD